MQIPTLPFTVTDWSRIEPTVYPGETGSAEWRTMTVGDIRVRQVTYSPGYVADHWCARGHIIYVVAGELVNELQDGRRTVLTAGMGYIVSDEGDSPHRSVTADGATLFIVD